MMNKSILASAVVGVLALSGAISVANATPWLEIVNSAGNTPTDGGGTGYNRTDHEVTGDPGGSSYPQPGSPLNGAGLPSSIPSR